MSGLGGPGAIEFLRELVSTPSPCGDEAAAVGVFVRTAAALGFEAWVDGAGNGVAWRKAPGHAEPGAEIVCLGHIDTVAGFPEVRVDDRGVLWGRGAVDAKGPLAAMLFAAARAALAPGTGVRVIAAVGEESPNSPGACFVRDRLRPAACIIGEPSGADGVTLGYKGRLIAHASARVSGAHSAGPGGSAADAVLAWWAGVLRRVEGLNAGREGAFETVQAGVRSMATRHDGFIDHAEMTAGFRLPTWATPAQAQGWAAESACGLGVELRFDGQIEAHRSERSDAVAQAISAAIRAEGMTPRPKVKTGTADMNVVAPAWRCPIAAYGPGDSALDHTPHERVSLEEYARSIAVLTRAIGALSTEIAAGPIPGERR